MCMLLTVVGSQCLSGDNGSRTEPVVNPSRLLDYTEGDIEVYVGQDLPQKFRF